MHRIDNIPWLILIIITLFLGLAPYSMGLLAGINPVPEAHVLEKLKMLGNGELVKPIDIFDLLLHATPWILIIIKGYRTLTVKQD